jgi:hypothetical protein
MPPATKRPLVSATSSSTIGDNDGGGDDNDDNDISTNKDESFVANSDDEEAKEAEEAYQQIKAFGDADRDVSVFSGSLLLYSYQTSRFAKF